MGMYYYGSQHFNHRCTLEHDLHDIQAIVGVGKGEHDRALSTRFVSYCAAPPEGSRLVEGISYIFNWYDTTVCEGLPSDVEAAIDFFAEDWLSRMKSIVDSTVGYVMRAELLPCSTYSFEKEDWPALIETIGHGATSDIADLERARDELYNAHDTTLTFLANALIHAIKHDISHMRVDDPHEGYSTNVWDVVADWVESTTLKSLDEEFLGALAQSYSQSYKSEGMEGLHALLTAHPNNHVFLENVVAAYISREQYEEVITLTTTLLHDDSLNQDTQALCLICRGDAKLCLERVAEAKVDADAAAHLGNDLLSRSYEWA